MSLSARTLILDLLSTVRHSAMPVRALVEAGALFGFADNNVRVSLSKLCAEGRVARDQRGRYRLSDAVTALANEIAGWRRLEEQHRAWGGGWIAIHCPKPGRGAARRRQGRALAMLGFAELEAGLHLRPNNLVGDIDAIRSRFVSLAGESDSLALVYGVHSLDPAAELRARSLWDADGLMRGYRKSIATLEASRKRLSRLSPEESLVECFLVGGAVVRQLNLDPLLPGPIVDPESRRALVDAMLDYDELGRAHWAPFVARHGVRPRVSPHGWRTTGGAMPEPRIEGAEA